MSEEKGVNITTIEKEKNVWITIIVCVAALIAIGGGIIIWNNRTDYQICFLVIMLLSIILIVLTFFYVSYLEYREKIYHSTLSVAKTIMALEKQKEKSVVQPARIEKITLDGKALISIDWPKNTNQNTSNQSNEKNGK